MVCLQGDMVYRGSSVFYCGAGPLGDTIKDMCSARNVHFNPDRIPILTVTLLVMRNVRNLKFKPEFFPVENFETKKA